MSRTKRAGAAVVLLDAMGVVDRESYYVVGSQSIDAPGDLRGRGCGGGVQLPSVNRGDVNVILILTRSEELRIISFFQLRQTCGNQRVLTRL